MPLVVVFLVVSEWSFLVPFGFAEFGAYILSLWVSGYSLLLVAMDCGMDVAYGMGEDEEMEDNSSGSDHQIGGDDYQGGNSGGRDPRGNWNDETEVNSAGGDLSTSEGSAILEPYEGMEFDSEEAAKKFYNAYARRMGFSVRIGSTSRSVQDRSIIGRYFVCSKEGFRQKKAGDDEDKVLKRKRLITREGCKAKLAVRKNSNGKWIVRIFIKEHNHAMMTPSTVQYLRSHKRLSSAAQSLNDTQMAVGVRPNLMMSFLRLEAGRSSNVGMNNILTLPPHYILKRFTKNAKSDVVVDGSGIEIQRDNKEFLAQRYTDLCQRAIKLVEDGMASVESYRMAILALDKAFEDIGGGNKVPVAVTDPPETSQTEKGSEASKPIYQTPANDSQPKAGSLQKMRKSPVNAPSVVGFLQPVGNGINGRHWHGSLGSEGPRLSIGIPTIISLEFGSAQVIALLRCYFLKQKAR
ncbi:FAR1-RELATED SEQUENCE 5 protein [Nymphaea thermarum]|nr:FAR1-RELATED SEQUENCE 5 protein [Nymphaea thermarum]